jgi:putative heme-binding domain-containing protein
VGAEVGPDLTGLWDSQSVDKLVEAVVEPSKEIKTGYQAFRVKTVKGLVFTGLLRSQTKEAIVLRDSTGANYRIAMKDVDSLTAMKTSLMPADVIKVLTFDQFIDLLAFLKNRKVQESLPSMPRKPRGK